MTQEITGKHIQAILVLGMHRSGTSALAGMIESLGAVGPRSQLPPTDANPKGYMESKQIMLFNDQLLKLMNSSWDDPYISTAQLQKTYKYTVKDYRRSTELLESEFEHADLMVFKDPRICRLLPFWQKAIRKINGKILPVLIIRNPLEVAQSLFARDQMPREKGLLLWLRHTLEAEFYTRKLKRVIVNFEDVIGDSKRIIEEIKNQFSLDDLKLAKLENQSTFINPELHHQKATIQHLINQPLTADWVLRCYEAMKKLTVSSEDKSEVFQSLDRLRDEFDRACYVFKPIIHSSNAAENSARSEKLQLQSQLKTAEQNAERLRQENTALKTLQDERSLHNGIELEQARNVAEVLKAEVKLLQDQISERDALASEQISYARPEMQHLRSDLDKVAEILNDHNHLVSEHTTQMQVFFETLSSQNQKYTEELSDPRSEYEARLSLVLNKTDQAWRSIELLLKDLSNVEKSLSQHIEESPSLVHPLLSQITLLQQNILEKDSRLSRERESYEALRQTHETISEQAKRFFQKLGNIMGLDLKDKPLENQIEQINSKLSRIEKSTAFQQNKLLKTEKETLVPDEKYVLSQAKHYARLRAKYVYQCDLNETLKASVSDLVTEKDEIQNRLNATLDSLKKISSERSTLEAQTQSVSSFKLESEQLKEQLHTAYQITSNRRNTNSLKRYYTKSRVRRKILSSGLFLTDYYEKQIRKHGYDLNGDPLDHYLEAGELLGLKPHPFFDPHWYVSTNIDVRNSAQSPLIHYALHGSREERQPHILFEPSVFLSSLPANPEPERELLDPIVRYLKFGREEGTNPNALFNTDFYLDKYPDVKRAGVNPLKHYIENGSSEGRSPSEVFDEVWYRKQYGELMPAGTSALAYHMLEGATFQHATNEASFHATCREKARADGLKTVLIFAHSASERIYGSERSLINAISAMDRSKYRLVLVLPNPSLSYINRCEKLVDKIVKTKSAWWAKENTLNSELIETYEELIRVEQADLVYVNTIMLREPLMAARKLDIPSICHVRELIDQDNDLQEFIGLSSEEIVSEVRSNADYIIANSQATANLYAKKKRLFKIFNAVDTDAVALPLTNLGSRPLRLGMLSSNTAKKGIYDLYEVAKLAAQENLPVEFFAYGPKNAQTQRIEAELITKNLDLPLSFPGYNSNAVDALAHLDVVLILSRFAESFGRTAAEAMSAQRPLIAYKRGALNEVILEGKTGFLVKPDSPSEVINAIKRLLADPELYARMGKAGREHALTNFSMGILSKNLNEAFEVAIERYDVSGQDAVTYSNSPQIDHVTPDSGQTPKKAVTAVVPNYNYAPYLEERLSSILNQTYPPKELIFLDDCSTDDSVEVARKFLSSPVTNPKRIPYRIIVNSRNEGVYEQWIKAFELSKTDWVWIAEADDTCDLSFLAALVEKIEASINIVYAQSRKMDEFGTFVTENYLHHTNDLDRERWKQDFVESGTQEVIKYLAYRNTIPNTSAVIMRKSAVAGVEEILRTYKYVGDWLLYAHLLRTGGIAFVSKSLNNFRRHMRSVTKSKNNTTPYLIELARIRLFIAKFFPILERDLERQNQFLDRDYQIEGNERNSQRSEIASLMHETAQICSKHRRIAIITTNNGSHNGGSEMLWQEAAFEMRVRGHDVIVLIKDWKPEPVILTELIRAGVKVLHKEFDGFSKLIQLRPDLTVISIGDQDEGTEYYERLHSEGLDYTIVNQLTKEVRFWARREKKQAAVKQGYLNAKKVFYTSKNNHCVMEDRLRCSLPNAAIHFNPYHIDRNLVPQYPSTEEGFRVAIPSKLLFLHKGQDLLLEALSDKKWFTRDVQFNFYGAGPDRPKIESAIRNQQLKHLTLKGRVSDISEIWKDNHALLMPSRMEGLPIMVVSALLSARTCILTDIGGHAEVVENNKTGFLIPDPNVNAVSDTLEKAYQHRFDWEEMGHLGRQDILKFLPENPIDDFLKKLDAIMINSEKSTPHIS